MVMALVLCSSTARSQTTYGVGYQAVGSFKIDDLDNGRTLASMGWGPGVTILDSLGTVIWTKYKWSNEASIMTGPLSVAKRSENSFYSVWGYRGEGCDRPGDTIGVHSQLVLCHLDSAGEIMEANRYVIGAACTYFASDLTVTEDQGAVIWSRHGLDGFYILKAQPDLAHQWSHFYNHNGSFQFVKELPGGDLLAGINMDTAGAAVARLDANGNMLWCKSYIRPRGIVHDAVVESDDSFVITGYTDSTGSVNPLEPLPVGYDPKLFLMKLNGEGEVQWCKGYEGADLWYARNGQQTVGASDMGYILMANAASASNIGYLPVLLKADINGDTLWTRTSNTPGHRYEPIDLVGGSDGGYTLSMAVYNPQYGGMYALFKTDPLGHFPCGDQSYPVQVIDLFPVDSAFTLTPASSGAVAYPVSFRDTIFDPITAEDLCAIVTAMPDPIRPRKPTIHPNPNTGHFTLDFPDPLTVDSFYSVYDATGRLLFQRPLAKGTESAEIDLSRFAKGTYVVRVSSREGVCYERVVVQ